MNSKDHIWVCWQEPEVDCGKTSQIPYNWVTEVLIGDGRAPGSVLKCRWPKTRRLYTAKVIAPPSVRHERAPSLHAPSLHAPSQPNSHYDDGDDIPILSVNEPTDHEESFTKMDVDSGDNSSEKSAGGTTSNTMPDITRQVKGGPLPRESPTAAPNHASIGRNLDDHADPELGAYSGDDHPPPVLMPEISHSNRPQQNSTPSSNSELLSTASSVFPKELQRWFMVQLSGLKSEIVNNFDQVNHKLAAMDLSIRNLRSRMDQMEGKIDLALLNSGSSPGISVGNGPENWPRAEGMHSNGSDERRELDGHNAVKKRRREEPVKDSASANRWSNGNSKVEGSTSQNWTSSSSLSTVVRHPSSPDKRGARKSIVHRAPPISPPPQLVREESATVENIQQSHPVLVRVSASPSISRLTQSSTSPRKKRKSTAPKLQVKYKPGSDEKIIYIGGDPNYEISVDLYAEALENVFDDTPVHLILSLLRRVLCDQDMARLWFKAETPTQPNYYALSPSFTEALKKQARSQYPEKPVTEKDYICKLSQATCDARYRIRHGKGSCSRPRSLFPLHSVAIPLTPPTGSGSGSRSTPSSTSSRPQEVNLDSQMINDDKEDLSLIGPIIPLGDADDSPAACNSSESGDEGTSIAGTFNGSSTKQKAAQKC